MGSIKVNDVFEELSEENKRLLNELLFANKCLNVLIKFKTFVNFISDKIKTNLSSNESEMFEELHKEVYNVLKDKTIVPNIFKQENDLTVTQSIPSQIKSKRKSNSIISSKIAKNLIQKETKSNLKLKQNLKTRISKKNDKHLDGFNVEESAEPSLKIINNFFVCDFIGCGKHFKSEKYFKSHLKTHSNTYSRKAKYMCDIDSCGFRTKCNKGFKVHMNSHFGIKPNKCSFCQMDLSTKKTLREHIEKKHQLSDQLLVCDFENCNKTYRSEASLKCHQMNNHIRGTFVACDYPNCTFKAISLTSLTSHKCVHSDIRPFICSFEGCGKAYKTESYLREHKRIHCKPTQVKCTQEDCFSIFGSEYLMKKHRRRSHPIFPRPKLVCEWPGCEYETTDRYGLKAHQILHSSERKFLCEWNDCQKKFKTKKDLNNHLSVHKQDKKYACSWPGCQYRCVFGGNLNKHMRVHQK